MGGGGAQRCGCQRETNPGQRDLISYTLGNSKNMHDFYRKIHIAKTDFRRKILNGSTGKHTETLLKT